MVHIHQRCGKEPGLTRLVRSNTLVFFGHEPLSEVVIQAANEEAERKSKNLGRWRMQRVGIWGEDEPDEVARPRFCRC